MQRPELFIARNPDLEEHVDWLLHRRVDVGSVLQSNLDRQRASQRFLKGPAHNLYQRRTVLNLFIHRYVLEQRTPRRSHRPDHRLLELAVISALRAQDVIKDLSRICNRRVVQRVQSITTADIDRFITDRSAALAKKLMTNLSLKNPRSAVNYLRRVAASFYVNRLIARMRRRNSALTHIERSTKLRRRTVLAFKLAYLVSSLTRGELQRLSTEYGVSDVRTTKYKIKDIAKLLRFKNPGTLYRKLYKVRQWASKAAGKPFDLTDSVAAQQVLDWMDSEDVPY